MTRDACGGATVAVLGFAKGAQPGMTVLLGATRHWRCGDNVSATRAARQCSGDVRVLRCRSGYRKATNRVALQIMSAAEVARRWLRDRADRHRRRNSCGAYRPRRSHFPPREAVRDGAQLRMLLDRRRGAPWAPPGKAGSSAGHRRARQVEGSDETVGGISRHQIHLLLL